MLKERYFGTDLARAMVLLVLPLIHIAEEGDYTRLFLPQAGNILLILANFFSILAAPVFMVCMGINMVLSRKQSPGDYALRGLSLLAVQIVLNILRFALPFIIGLELVSPGAAENEMKDFLFYSQLNSDILSLAGLCFLTFALFRQMRLSPAEILAVTVAAGVICELIVQYISPVVRAGGNLVVCSLLGSFIWVKLNSFFPLLEWLVFPAAGLMLGRYLKNAADEKAENKIFALATGASFVVLAVCLAWLKLSGQEIYVSICGPLNDYHMTPVCTASEIALSFIFIGSLHFLNEWLRPGDNQKVKNFISRLSVNVTGFYIVQWIIIGWLEGLSGGLDLWYTQSIGLALPVVTVAAVTVVSCAAAPAAAEIVRNFQSKITGLFHSGGRTAQ